MDENELLALLTGMRQAPISVCRIPHQIAAAIGALTTLVRLSPSTVRKQESKHRDSLSKLYLRAPIIITEGHVRISPPRHLVFIYHEEREKTRSFKAVVKSTTLGHELYLVSIHRVSRGDVRAAFRRTVDVEEWCKGRREVGPPRNPT